MNDTLKITGTITLELIDSAGHITARRQVRNIVTNAGRQAIIDRLQGNTPAVCDYIAIGTGTVAAAAANTTLGTEIARAQGALSQPDAHTDRCAYTFAAGTGTGAITECGRLNAGASGTLMGRQVFAVVNKGANDSLQVTYDFTYAAA